MGKSIFLKKGTVNTSIWYFLMSVYESKSINEDSRKHLSRAINVSTGLRASDMHFQVKKGGQNTLVMQNNS